MPKFTFSFRTENLAFVLAVFITFLVFFAALFFTSPPEECNNRLDYGLLLLDYWQDGFWGLLAFSMQMMLILILGHVLALTPVVKTAIENLIRRTHGAVQMIVLLSFFSLLAGWFNWGLGLIFSAILAKKMGVHAQKNNIKISYPLLGAAAYSCMVVWHAGLSGSAPLSIAEKEHFLMAQSGVVPIDLTLFSPMNLVAVGAVFVFVPLALVLVHVLQKNKSVPEVTESINYDWLHKHQALNPLCLFLGLLMLLAAVFQVVGSSGFQAIGLNFVNFALFGLGLLLMGNFTRFLKGVADAIQGASGILTQFPLYAGIMGIMSASGLLDKITLVMLEGANEQTYPIFTFLTATVVNFFVPSGGGQWAVQGPLIAASAPEVGVAFPKAVMAMAYGDQLSNMIQPFWALPLLAITGLMPRAILPFTAIIMLVAGMVYLGVLLIF